MSTKHIFRLSTQQVIELRDFVAYAVRNRYSTKAACARMVALCEHTLLRALIREPKERR